MTPKERAQRILFAGKTHGELWDTIEQAIIAATDAANVRMAVLEAGWANTRSLLQKSDDRVVRLHERINALEAQLAEANERAEANYHRMPRRGELGAAIQRAEAAEARAEVAEKKARDLALVIETAPTYAEPRIAARVINQLTERAEQAEAREGRLREAIESVFQEKRGGVYFSFSAKNGLSYSYRLDEDRAEAVRGILRVLKAATRPDRDHPSRDDRGAADAGAEKEGEAR